MYGETRGDLTPVASTVRPPATSYTRGLLLTYYRGLEAVKVYFLRTAFLVCATDAGASAFNAFRLVLPLSVPTRPAATGVSTMTA